MSTSASGSTSSSMGSGSNAVVIPFDSYTAGQNTVSDNPITPDPDQIHAYFLQVLASCKEDNGEYNIQKFMAVFMQVVQYYSGQLDQESVTMNQVADMQTAENGAQSIWNMGKNFDGTNPSTGVQPSDIDTFMADTQAEWAELSKLGKQGVIDPNLLSQFKSAIQSRLDAIEGYTPGTPAGPANPRIVLNDDGTMDMSNAAPSAEAAANINVLWYEQAGSSGSAPDPTAQQTFDAVTQSFVTFTQSMAAGAVNNQVQALIKFYVDTQNQWTTALYNMASAIIGWISGSVQKQMVQ